MPIEEKYTSQNPEFEKFYQSFADLGAVFAIFHEDRINNNQLPFAPQLQTDKSGRHLVTNDKGQIQAYSPKLDKEVNSVFKTGSASILLDYQTYVFDGYYESFRQFLGELGIGNYSGVLKDVAISEPWKKFLGDSEVRSYLGNLINNINSAAANGLARTLYSDTENLFRSGAGTGNKVVAQLLGIFQEDFVSRLAIMASQISLSELPSLQVGIGVESGEVAKQVNKGKEIKAHEGEVITSTGLDRNKLLEFGLGEADGCPAGRRPSLEIRAFFTKKYLEINQSSRELPTTMLGSFADLYKTNFVVDILNSEVKNEAAAELENKRRLRPHP